MSVYKKYVNVQGGQTPFISASKGGGCFPAGSLVSTTRGEIPIEDIKINDKVYRAASVIELIHTATLVHDDVVDSSNMRRGFFSLNALGS